MDKLERVAERLEARRKELAEGYGIARSEIEHMHISVFNDVSKAIREALAEPTPDTQMRDFVHQSLDAMSDRKEPTPPQEGLVERLKAEARDIYDNGCTRRGNRHRKYNVMCDAAAEIARLTAPVTDGEIAKDCSVLRAYHWDGAAALLERLYREIERKTIAYDEVAKDVVRLTERAEKAEAALEEARSLVPFVDERLFT
jgi:hypothetical protein